ncbi:aldehyde dehydrogenase family protein [Rhodococcus qingshengii]|uniref:aldehyde dehydrogenase family protein n=1 Tax=Rhodococcus qingshengii TaxID=334542 RepID=UPI001BE92F56|nr:aldehyde dehydrogenase family protein [Rhodococcus qingshengii]MBT2273894.1 aldehyde dehydrogenase family protein [Rhodococcus qingshengii]
MTISTPIDPSTRIYRTVNPATGDILHEWPQMTDDEAGVALDRAHDAFLSWRATPVARKVGLFHAAADAIDARADDLAHQVTLEMGKPLVQSTMEVGSVTQMFRYYADHGEELLADEHVAIPGVSRAVTRREPVGVLLGIEPWNAPLYQAMRAAVPNLMLGNTVLLKPSEITAGSTLMLDEILLGAGFPADVYQTSLLSTTQVSTLIADPRVRALTLTGSDRAGSAVGEQAGKHIKPVVLELGGSDAFIVLDSADVEQAAAVAANVRLFYSGQVCVSPKRVIITDKVADRFIAEYAKIFANQTVGDPFDAATTIGPLSSTTAAGLVQDQLQDAVDKGATVLVPGGQFDKDSAFFTPAVVSELTPDMRLYYEEAFGPIGIIFRVKDATAAVELANDSKYGLGGTVYGETAEAEEVARQLDTGTVGINTYYGAPVEAPFGGTKASGFGRELGRAGMDNFANIKTYAIA